MKRHASPPRENWQAKVESVGLSYHSLDNTPYWDESACYELTAAEVDALESAANALHFLCIDAAEAVIVNNWWDRLAIPQSAIPAILQSWDRDDFSIYGRFDLSYDGSQPPKLLEYNADTPTALLEAAVAQWFWLQDTRPDCDQFNSIHERLIAGWKRWGGAQLHFACMKDNPEDEMTILYLRDTCEQAGVKTKSVFIQDIGWDSARNRFVDLDLEPIERCFKLYPWEWIWRDDFARHLSSDPIRFLEPAWKMLLSNKGLLPILWELFPGHPNLLPAYETPERLEGTFVRKPILSREGANVALVEKGVVVAQTAGAYTGERSIFQALASGPDFGGFHPVFGVWVIDHEAGGLGIREDTARITGNLSRFVPHFFFCAMSFVNPTQIRLGMEGTFFSKKYRVIGRAVLSTFDFGTLYYWHEFYLETSGGSLATLVFEMTETGPAWRWFTIFKPRKPLSADEAATKVTTDSVTIDDDTFQITRVSRSRVCFVANRTQKDVRIDSVAHYFNALRGKQLLVVSWTGQEVEFYEGSNVSVQMVSSGFNLHGPRRLYFDALGGRALWRWIFQTPVLFTLGFVVFIGFALWLANSDVPKLIQHTPPPKSTLSVGESATLSAVHYRITGNSVKEIDQVDRRFDRQEYDLLSDDSQKAELIQESTKWLLCIPLTPQTSLAPTAAAAIQTGQSILIDSVPYVVTTLFRDRLPNATESLWAGDTTLYGFTATNSHHHLTVEWDATNVLYQETTTLPDASIRSAFH